jgi:hypothetical protein
VQMLAHYLNDRDDGPAAFLDETSIGVLVASHLGDALPRYLEFDRAAQRLAASTAGTPEAAAATKHAHSLLRASQPSLGEAGIAVRRPRSAHAAHVRLTTSAAMPDTGACLQRLSLGSHA